ncbi:MAG: hydroxymethylbilane synthase [Pseudomonadota bacterium]
MQRTFTLGSRGSELALIQTETVRNALAAAHGWSEEEAARFARIRPMSTAGDRIQDKALREFGGKGLFTKEIETALLEGRIDMAVHSMKDMPTVLPGGLVIPCVLPREAPNDVLLANVGTGLADLPQGGRLGVSSLRRRAQALRARPDLKTQDLRGNVNTRIKKLRQGDVDATFLALAGLTRMGREDEAACVLPTEEMLPAVAQGIVGVEVRTDDDEIRKTLAAIHCETTYLRLVAERSYLKRLDGSCRTPIAGLAEIEAGEMRLRGEVLSLDGAESYSVERSAKLGANALEAAEALGRAAAEALIDKAGERFLAGIAAAIDP